MASFQNPLFFLTLMFIFTSWIFPATAEPCSSYTFPNQITYAICKDLPTLESSLHWSYHRSSSTMDVALAIKNSNARNSTWVDWAFNLTSKGTVDSQALAAFHKPDDESLLFSNVHTSPVAHNVSTTHANEDMIVFASLQLPNNTTYVWQQGFVSDDGTLEPPNLHFFVNLNFITGEVLETHSKTIFIVKNVHGILNALGWGILLPIGIIFYRLSKAFDIARPTLLVDSYVSLTCLIGIAGTLTGAYMNVSS